MSGKRKGPPILYTPVTPVTPVLVDVIDLEDLAPAPVKRTQPKSNPERDVVKVNVDLTADPFPDLDEIYEKLMVIVAQTIQPDAIEKELDEEKASERIRDGWLGMEHISLFVGAITLTGFKISDRVRILDGFVMSMKNRTLETNDYTTRLAEKTRVSREKRLSAQAVLKDSTSAQKAIKSALEAIKSAQEAIAMHTSSYRATMGEEVVVTLQKMLPIIDTEEHKKDHESVESVFTRLRSHAEQNPRLVCTYIVLAPIMSHGNHWTLAHITYNARRGKLDIRLFDSLPPPESPPLTELVNHGTVNDSPAFHCRELIAAFHTMDPRTRKPEHTKVYDVVSCSIFVCLAILRSTYGGIPDFDPKKGAPPVSAADIAKVRRIIATMRAYRFELGRASTEKAAREQKDDVDVYVDGKAIPVIQLWTD